MLVSVCICTYKRAHLAKTLNSVATLIIPPDIELEVIVVDNDILQSGLPIINSLQADYPHKLLYCHEPQKNISIARNAYLNAAQGEWIASLDDDEIAAPYWLKNLLSVAQEFKADVVFGQVASIYPEGTPDWIVAGNFLGYKAEKTGSVVSSGGTGSTLIKHSILQTSQYQFDSTYGLTGGEDAHLFYRLYQRGYKLIVCREAIVSEHVEENRINCKYLIKRAFRIGQTYSRYRYGHGTKLLKKIAFVTKIVLKLNFYLIKTIITIPFGKKVWFRALLDAADCLGKISYFCSESKVELYK